MNKRAVAVILMSVCLGSGWPAVAAGEARHPARPSSASGDNAVATWNANAGQAAVLACLSPDNDPFHESRMYAMMHVAIHDALNAIDRRSRPYAMDIRVAPGASPEAAVAAAAHDVLVPVLRQIPAISSGCIDAGVASVEADYSDALGAIPDGAAKTQGVAVGQAAAAVILAVRAADGADTPFQDFAYPQGTQPGQYRFTPGQTFAAVPGWGDVTPFVLRDSSQFRTGPPYAVTQKQYTADFNEVKRLGGDGVTTPSDRTPDQTQIALFWVESSPLMWNRIARIVSGAAGLDMWESARLFGLLNMAMADGYIGSLDTKYFYNYWRPVTAIQEADTDGNPDTSADKTWTPLKPTPPIPDYDSGHAVQGGVAAEVLTKFFHTDHMSFTTCSFSLPAGSTCNDPSPTLRSFTSFSQAADENGLSRILVGFHFRKAVTAGIAHGRKIADRAVSHTLRLVH
jgi:hypothetical protein